MKRSLIMINYTLWLINKKITSKIIQSHFIYKKEIAAIQLRYGFNLKLSYTLKLSYSYIFFFLIYTSVFTNCTFIL